MSARAIAVQGFGFPAMAVATQGFRGVFIGIPGTVIWIPEETRRFTLAGVVRAVRIAAEVRVILIPPEPPIPAPEFVGVVSIPVEPTAINVSDDVRLILVLEEA